MFNLLLLLELVVESRRLCEGRESESIIDVCQVESSGLKSQVFVSSWTTCSHFLAFFACLRMEERVTVAIPAPSSDGVTAEPTVAFFAAGFLGSSSNAEIISALRAALDVPASFFSASSLSLLYIASDTPLATADAMEAFFLFFVVVVLSWGWRSLHFANSVCWGRFRAVYSSGVW